MQCIVVKSDEFENSSPLYIFPLNPVFLLLAPFGRSAAIIFTLIHLRYLSFKH